MVVLTGPEDPLADAEAVRLVSRASQAGELALKVDRAAEAVEVGKVASYAGRGTSFRSDLIALTGENPGKLAQAHHVFPNKFGQLFLDAGIDVNRAEYGAWWETGDHLAKARGYNLRWGEFFKGSPTRDEILDYGRELAGSYGFKVNY